MKTINAQLEAIQGGISFFGISVDLDSVVKAIGDGKLREMQTPVIVSGEILGMALIYVLYTELNRPPKKTL